MRIFLAALIWASACAGCSSHDPGQTRPASVKNNAGAKPAKISPALAPTLETVGKVVSVNAVVRFVVLDFPLNSMPAMGQKMSVYHAGQKTGEIKISGPQNETNIVADITAGTVQAGDEVRAD